MKIFELLEGNIVSEHLKLNQFLIDFNMRKEKILWYPSSGDDFRDIVNFSPIVNKNIEFKDLPNIFIHNDYDGRTFNRIRTSNEYNTILFKDEKTKVSIKEKINLRFNLHAKVNYKIRENYVDHYEYRFKTPHLYLLKLNIDTTLYGRI